LFELQAPSSMPETKRKISFFMVKGILVINEYLNEAF
jgi:hypothetical protein